MVDKNIGEWRALATISVDQAALILGVSRGRAYESAKTGELPTLTLGRRLLVPVARLRALLGETTGEPGAASNTALLSAEIGGV
jgi:excisionase family DNA binding protein